MYFEGHGFSARHLSREYMYEQFRGYRGGPEYHYRLSTSKNDENCTVDCLKPFGLTSSRLDNINVYVK